MKKINESLYIPDDFVKDHSYYADNEGTKRYSGVTSIIGVLAKDGLIPWAAKESVRYIEDNAEYDAETDEYTISRLLMDEAKTAHVRKKETAGMHGTNAHALVAKYINESLLINDGAPLDLGNGYSGPDPTFDSIEPFITFSLENVDHFLFSERPMADPVRFVAGTADFAYVGKDGKRYIADFKTSPGVYGIDYFLQVAAYRMLAESEGDEKYDGAVIVRLGKDGSFDLHYRYDAGSDLEAFLACLTLYRAQSTFVKARKTKITP